jgi:hypothetical protein
MLELNPNDIFVKVRQYYEVDVKIDNVLFEYMEDIIADVTRLRINGISVGYEIADIFCTELKKLRRSAWENPAMYEKNKKEFLEIFKKKHINL